MICAHLPGVFCEMASATIESMIVEDKSEREKPVDREKVSIILLCFPYSQMKAHYR
jgi:hypothetical protein